MNTLKSILKFIVQLVYAVLRLVRCVRTRGARSQGQVGDEVKHQNQNQGDDQRQEEIRNDSESNCQ